MACKSLCGSSNVEATHLMHSQPVLTRNLEVVQNIFRIADRRLPEAQAPQCSETHTERPQTPPPSLAKVGHNDRQVYVPMFHPQVRWVWQPQRWHSLLHRTLRPPRVLTQWRLMLSRALPGRLRCSCRPPCESPAPASHSACQPMQ